MKRTLLLPILAILALAVSAGTYLERESGTYQVGVTNEDAPVAKDTILYTGKLFNLSNMDTSGVWFETNDTANIGVLLRTRTDNVTGDTALAGYHLAATGAKVTRIGWWDGVLSAMGGTMAFPYVELCLRVDKDANSFVRDTDNRWIFHYMTK